MSRRPDTIPAEEWNLTEQLNAATQNLRGANRVIAAMWVWHREMKLAGADYATGKTEAERMLGRAVVRYRTEGERSADVAEKRAMAEDDQVYFARLKYRTAEQREKAARAALDVLQAELDNLRTQAADARAENMFMTRRGDIP